MSADNFLSRPLRHSSDLISRQVSGRVQVCHFAAGGDTLFEIEGLAAQLWLKIDGTLTGSALIEQMLALVGPDNRPHCRQDCEAFLRELVEKKLVI